MNDYDYVAAESAEQANEWYEKEFGEPNDFEEVEEISLDTTFLTMVTDAEEDELNQGFERKLIGEKEAIRIPFRYTLSQMKEPIEKPWVAASTEW